MQDIFSKPNVQRNNINLVFFFSAGDDYIPVTQAVYFAPGVTSHVVRVQILDDNGFPKVEGSEIFELVLRTPINARITRPHKTRISITDFYSDRKY